MGTRHRASSAGVNRIAQIGVIAAAAWGGTATENVWAGPADGTVVHGNVSFVRNGNQWFITASDGSIIQYSSFNIAAHELVRFIQPHELARVLNRITGTSPTLIDGTLLANGQVYIVNPAGVVFGNGAVVNVGGIHAAAGHLSNEDFLAGVDRFTGLTGSVVNHGQITGGQIHLLGRNVSNHGALTSTGGIITMLAGNDIWIRRIGERIAVRIDGQELLDQSRPKHGGTSPDMLGTPGVENTGSIRAGGRGQIALGAGDLYSLAIRNTGEIRSAGGTIDLVAADGLVQNDGWIDASDRTSSGGLPSGIHHALQMTSKTGGGAAGGGAGGASKWGAGTDQPQVAVHDADRLLALDRSAPGGRVTVQGPSVVNRGTIEADGDGGSVEVTSQHHTYLTPGSRISAAGGSAHGAGGDILIHSYEGTTILANGASVDARGGTLGGDGGFVEISGETVLVNGDVHLRARNGSKNGTLLIDPLNIIIDAVGGDDAFLGDGTFEFAENGAVDSYIAASTLANIFGLIRLQAQGSIFVEEQVNLQLHNDVWFEAYGNIILNEAIVGARNLWLHADWDNDSTGFVVIEKPLSVTEGTIFRGQNIRLQGNSITTGISQIYNGPVWLGTDMVLNTQELIFNGAIDSKATTPDRGLVINATNTYFNGAVGFLDHLRSIEVHGNTWMSGGGAATRLDQTWHGPVYLGADASMTSWEPGGATIRFMDVVDGPFRLFAQSNGIVRFDQTVGGVDQLVGLHVGPGGATHLYADIHAGEIDIENNLVLNTDLTLFAPVSVKLSQVTGGGNSLSLVSDFKELRGVMSGINAFQTNAAGMTRLSGADLSANWVYFGDVVDVAMDSSVHANSTVRFERAIDGVGGLAVSADGSASFGDSIGANQALAWLTIDAGLPNDLDTNTIIFEGDRVIAVGDIRLNSGGRAAPVQVASIAGLQSLLIESLNGDVVFGQNEKLTVLGDLIIRALNGTATVGDLNALANLTVDASIIEILSRAGGSVYDENGNLLPDTGVDFYAGGDIFFSQIPVLLGAGSGPLFLAGGSMNAALAGFATGIAFAQPPAFVENDKGGRVLDIRILPQSPQPPPPPPPPPGPTPVPGDLTTTFGADLEPIYDRVDRDPIAIRALESLSLFLRGLSNEELVMLTEGRAIYVDPVATGVDGGPLPTNAARLRRDAVIRLLDSYSRLFVVESAITPGEAGNRADAIRAALDRAWAEYRASGAAGSFAAWAVATGRTEVAAYLEGLRTLVHEMRALGANQSELRAAMRSVLGPITPGGLEPASFAEMLGG